MAEQRCSGRRLASFKLSDTAVSVSTTVSKPKLNNLCAHENSRWSFFEYRFGEIEQILTVSIDSILFIT